MGLLFSCIAFWHNVFDDLWYALHILMSTGIWNKCLLLSFKWEAFLICLQSLHLVLRTHYTPALQFKVLRWVEESSCPIYALMDCLFDHNICGERPHEHTSSITNTHMPTHTPLIVPFPPETLYSEQKGTHIYHSFTPPPQQRWPLHLHLYYFYTHTHQGRENCSTSHALCLCRCYVIYSVWRSRTFRSMSLSYSNLGVLIITGCVSEEIIWTWHPKAIFNDTRKIFNKNVQWFYCGS